MKMETATLSSTSTDGLVDSVRPRAPRFEAFVMTGDAILNLSRTAHSPEFLPIHSKKKKNQRQSLNSLPNSPCELVQSVVKPWEQEDVPTKLERIVQDSTSANASVNIGKPDDHIPIGTTPELNNRTEGVSPSSNTSPECGKDNERIVWTYNAPLSEQEVRRLEADQFWLHAKQHTSFKQINQLMKINENTEASPDASFIHRDYSVKNQAFENNQVFESYGTSKIVPMALEPDNSSAKGEAIISLVTEEESFPTCSGKEIQLAITSPSDEESDADSLQSFHYSPKGVDMPSAIRLAKRLYMLDGFQKSDVSRHLCKNNDFNRVVAEEYLKHFDFGNIALDLALRQFLLAFQLTGESSERDRVLVHFSSRYLQCNPNSFTSQDGVHILTCALLLLNSDLHGKHQGMKRMTCAQFIKRLSGLNDGGNFPVELLRRLYSAIKDQPLEWASDSPKLVTERDLEPLEIINAPKETSSNPYLDIPSPVHSQEFKKGYIMRKCCIEPNGKRTPLGKRSWRMYFAVLKDLVLYLYKDEATCKGELPPRSSGTVSRKKSVVDKDPGPAVLIRVHHALAASSPDYTKKQNVFRLFTADRAQFLVQTSDTKELRCWMDAINTAASLLSAPPLPPPVGSQQRFQRPLLPATLSKLPARDQLLDHEDRVLRLERDLREHRANPPPTHAKSALVNIYREKDSFLHYEKTRYEAYSAVLRAAFGSTPNHDLSLLELDERSESGKTSPDFKVNDDTS